MDSVPKPGGIPTGKERYIKGAALGEGTFGVVTKAEDTVTHKIVAIKKIRLGKYKEGVNFTAIREIKLLQELRHPHVIELVDCFPHKRNLNLVFECCESDLEAVIKDKFLPLGTPEIKSYMQMTLRAVAYCHECWVLHRDLKPNNLLIAPNGALKLADFGLARVFGSPNRKFTHQVFARWYRAPELLLGSKAYGPGVDVWAVGCVFAELMLRKPFFPGSSDIDQLGRIYQGLGTPTEETWPGHKTLPDYMEFSKTPAPDLRGVFATAPPEALDLLKKLMAFDPNRRVSAAEALRHAYFSAQPLATPFPDLPRPTQKFGDEGGGANGGGDARAAPRGGSGKVARERRRRRRDGRGGALECLGEAREDRAEGRRRDALLGVLGIARVAGDGAGGGASGRQSVSEARGRRLRSRRVAFVRRADVHRRRFFFLGRAPGRGSGPAGADHGGRGVPAEAEARAGRRVPGGVAGYRNRASRRRVVAIARAQPRRENVESSRISRSAISRGAAFSRTRARTNILLFERPHHIYPNIGHS